MEVLTRDEAVSLFNEMFDKRVRGLAILHEKNNPGKKDMSAANCFIEAYCERFKIAQSEIMRENRASVIVEHRFIIWYVLRQHYGFSLTELGKIFDKDHSTVINGLGRIKDLMDSDKKIYNRVMNAMKLL